MAGLDDSHGDVVSEDLWRDPIPSPDHLADFQEDKVEARRTEHPDATAAPRDGICAAATEWGTGRVRATEAPRMFEQHRSLIGR